MVVQWTLYAVIFDFLSFFVLWEPLFCQFHNSIRWNRTNCIDRFSLLPSSVWIEPSVSASVVLTLDKSLFIYSACYFHVWRTNKKKINGEIKTIREKPNQSAKKLWVFSWNSVQSFLFVATVLKYSSYFIYRIDLSRSAQEAVHGILFSFIIWEVVGLVTTHSICSCVFIVHTVHSAHI